MKKYITLFFVATVIALFSGGSAHSGDLCLQRAPLDDAQCPLTAIGGESDCSSITITNRCDFTVLVTIDTSKPNTSFIIDAVNCHNKYLGHNGTCIVNAKFKPQSRDTRLNVTYRAACEHGRFSCGSEFFRFAGRLALPVPQLTPNSIDFGEQRVGSTYNQLLKLKNVGNANLFVEDILAPAPGSGFSVTDSCGDTLIPDAACDIQVGFEPLRAITYSTNFDVITGDGADTDTWQIPLLGKGLSGDIPAISFNKTAIDFGTQAVDQDYTDTITITSSGNENLEIYSPITLEGEGFSQTNDCESTFTPGATCTITVKFSPTAQASYSGKITIRSNAADSPHTISLSGKGFAYFLYLIPPMLNFGNQRYAKESLPQVVKLYNSGVRAVTINSISTSSPYIFKSTSYCGSTLDPKSMCEIHIVFAPPEVASYRETLTVVSAEAGQITGYLVGKGTRGATISISPSFAAFYKVPVGEKSQQMDFLVANTGDEDVALNEVNTYPSCFNLEENSCPSTLAVAALCKAGVTFNPTFAGVAQGLLSVLADTPLSPYQSGLLGEGTQGNITITPGSINFGHQTIGKSSLAHDIVLRNSGNQTVNINDIASTSSVFTQMNDCSETLAPSGSCTINVIFTPDTEVQTKAAINIVTDAPGSPHVVGLMGIGLDPSYPDLDVSPDIWDFGGVQIGTASTAKEFTVKNTGIKTVTIYEIVSTSDFEQTNECSSTIEADATCTITGTFTPRSSGNITGNIVVMDDTFDGYQNVDLIGSGFSPAVVDINVSKSSISFGNVNVGSESSAQSVTLVSTGTSAVEIGDIDIAGDESVDYDLNTDCENRLLDVGMSCSIDVIFAPTSVAEKTAMIIIYDDTDAGPHSVSLSGTGTNVGGGGCALGKSGAPDAMSVIAAIFIIVLFSVTLRSFKGYVLKRK